MIATTWGRTRGLDTREHRRGRRVMLLLMGIILMSLADLALTLSHLQTIGMMEANPLAAWLIRSTQSPLALTAFKTITVAVSVSLLWTLRRHLEGEIGAWCHATILVILTLMWGSYAAELDDPEIRRLAQTGAFGDEWLVME